LLGELTAQDSKMISANGYSRTGLIPAFLEALEEVWTKIEYENDMFAVYIPINSCDKLGDADSSLDLV
jgi:hypothetical protein